MNLDEKLKIWAWCPNIEDLLDIIQDYMFDQSLPYYKLDTVREQLQEQSPDELRRIKGEVFSQIENLSKLIISLEEEISESDTQASLTKEVEKQIEIIENLVRK